MSKLSIVVPVFNEGQGLEQGVAAIVDHIVQAQVSVWEVIFVNDGSKPDTERVLGDIASQYADVRVVHFARNFGKEAAIHAGLQTAEGDAVIVMDADMQHPPELIPQMVALWQSGARVVEAVKRDRNQQGRIYSGMANAYYWFFRKACGVDLKNHTDYKLLDRSVVAQYLSWPEKQRFFRGLIAWAGFTTAQIPFDVPKRAAGQSSWGQLKRFAYGVNNLSSFTALPLHFVSIMGLVAIFAAFVLGLVSIWHKLNGVALDGFTTVNLLVIGLGSAILLALGVISHYLARIYEEVKKRPAFVVKDNQSDGEQ